MTGREGQGERGVGKMGDEQVGGGFDGIDKRAMVVEDGGLQVRWMRGRSRVRVGRVMSGWRKMRWRGKTRGKEWKAMCLAGNNSMACFCFARRLPGCVERF